MWFPVQKQVCQVQTSVREACIPDPADLDMDYGGEEPDLCFSRSQVRDPAYALLDSGATHVLLPGHMLPKEARSFEVTVNLAVGKEKAKCWRNEVYAQERAHPLLPLGRLTNLLDTKFVWEDGTAVMQCNAETRGNGAQWRSLRSGTIWLTQARCSLKCYAELYGFSKLIQTQSSIGSSERAAHDPKMTSYLSHGVKAKMCETTPFVNSVGTQYIASRAQIEKACDSLRQQGSSVKKAIGLANVDLCTPAAETQSKHIKWTTTVVNKKPAVRLPRKDSHVLCKCKCDFGSELTIPEDPFRTSQGKKLGCSSLISQDFLFN